MTAAASRAGRTPMTPWGSAAHSGQLRQHPKPPSSTTPRGGPPTSTPASVGQPLPPPRRSPSAAAHPSTVAAATAHPAVASSSPNYFGLVVGADEGNPVDSAPGGHARKNWKSPPAGTPAASRAGAGGGAATATPSGVPHEANPAYEEFRRQSAAGHGAAFRLGGDANLAAFARTHSGASTASAASSARSPLDTGGQDRRPLPAVVQRDHGPPAPSPAEQADAMDIDTESRPPRLGSVTGLPRNDSPANMAAVAPPPPRSGSSQPHPPALSYTDERNARLSLPQHRVSTPTAPGAGASSHGRASTLPSNLGGELLSLLEPSEYATLATTYAASPAAVLLLDLRVSPQFAAARLRGALNLCIPTTLLKRPSFDVQRLLDTFPQPADRRRFAAWRQARHIVVYDAASTRLQDAAAASWTVRKFALEGWQGRAHVLRGGFAAATRALPHLVEAPGAAAEADPDAEDMGPSQASVSRGGGSSSGRNLSIDAAAAIAASNGGSTGPTAVAGGCPLPANPGGGAANPFFGNIRQNMDLLAGPGQLPVQRPAAALPPDVWARLPPWLRRAADEADRGRAVARTFHAIEQAEQARLQAALTADVAYKSGAPTGGASSAGAGAVPRRGGAATAAAPSASRGIQVAGIEKGTKNRYKDILPFEHARVRLQGVSPGGCDYVNASHVGAPWSPRRYIAAQAPTPATFADFWRVVWEQDARVIVMLTAESDGPATKADPYWRSGRYGPMQVECLDETKVPLHSSPANSATGPRGSSLRPSPPERPSPGRRRATNPLGGTLRDAPLSAAPTVSSSAASTAPPPPPQTPTVAAAGEEPPHVLVRTLALRHHAQPRPGAAQRTVTQLQYTQWPDFGAPAHARDVLALVEHVHGVARGHARPAATATPGRTGGRSGNGAASGGMPAALGGGPEAEADPAALAREDARALVVHCSAGCGRTGTFCTVDTVLDALQRQGATASARRTPAAVVPATAPADDNDDDDDHIDDRDDHDDMDVDSAPPGAEASKAAGTAGADADADGAANGDVDVDVAGGATDLVARAVADFRGQRLSMVQTLRQFVLCYETVLEWAAREAGARVRRENARRSYQG